MAMPSSFTSRLRRRDSSFHIMSKPSGVPNTTSSATGRTLAVVAWAAILFAATLYLMGRQIPPAAIAEQRRDAALYSGIIDDLRAGQPYYDSVGTELRTRGYPTRPIFNFREPLLYVTMARLSDEGAHALLIALASVLLCAVLIGKSYPTLTPLFMAQALALVLVPGPMYFTELWAGICLGLSAVALTVNRRILGVGLAILALCIRELAAPFCVASTLYAIYRREWREVRAWMTGAVLYAVYYSWHAWQAAQHVLSTDLARSHSWLYGGGLSFLLGTLQWTGVVRRMPLPVFAAYIVVAIAAWWAPAMPRHVRISVIAYAAFFMVVGQPFDVYWGMMIGPLLAVWMGHAPSGIKALLAQPVVARSRSLSLKPPSGTSESAAASCQTAASTLSPAAPRSRTR